MKEHRLYAGYIVGLMVSIFARLITDNIYFLIILAIAAIAGFTISLLLDKGDSEWKIK